MNVVEESGHGARRDGLAVAQMDNGETSRASG